MVSNCAPDFYRKIKIIFTEELHNTLRGKPCRPLCFMPQLETNRGSEIHVLRRFLPTVMLHAAVGNQPRLRDSRFAGKALSTVLRGGLLAVLLLAAAGLPPAGLRSGSHVARYIQLGRSSMRHSRSSSSTSPRRISSMNSFHKSKYSSSLSSTSLPQSISSLHSWSSIELT